MKKLYPLSLIVLSVLAMAYAVYCIRHPMILAAMGIDWYDSFRPAALSLHPYAVDGFYSPPWLIPLILPFAILPEKIGYVLFASVNIALFTYAAWKLKIKWFLIPFLVVFGYMVWNSFYGNVEGLVALGLVLPPQIEVFFLLLKPQIGIPVVLVLAWKIWREQGLNELIRTFLPITTIIVLSVILYGLWFLKSNNVIDAVWNASVWPIGIPLGIILFCVSLYRRDIRWSLVAVPFLTPYMAWHTWSFMILGLNIPANTRKLMTRFQAG